jgi:hypothetical protein
LILKKKKKFKLQILSNIYINILQINKKKYLPESLFFSILLHKKLQYFMYELNNKLIIKSAGQLFGIISKKTKFFKKTRKSIGTSIAMLKKKLHLQFKYINFFYCKNFNYRNYLWLKKYIQLIKPSFNYFFITRNWLYLHKNKRRLKKKIWRNLIKNNKIK